VMVSALTKPLNPCYGVDVLEPTDSAQADSGRAQALLRLYSGSTQALLKYAHPRLR
jgi:hypothetical protein